MGGCRGALTLGARGGNGSTWQGRGSTVAGVGRPKLVVRMAGALAIDELAILREQIGAGAYAQTMAALPAAIRDEFLSLTAVGWVDVESVKAVFLAAAQVTGRPPEEVHRDAIRAGTEHTFRHVWRILLRALVSDEMLISRAPSMYAKTYDTGRLSARMLAPGRAEMLVEGWPDAEEYSMRGLGIGVETVLQLAGRENTRATFYRTADGGKILVTWSK